MACVVKKNSITWNFIVLCDSGNYICGIRNDNCHLSYEISQISTSEQDDSISYANNTESDSPLQMDGFTGEKIHLDILITKRLLTMQLYLLT